MSIDKADRSSCTLHRIRRHGRPFIRRMCRPVTSITVVGQASWQVLITPDKRRHPQGPQIMIKTIFGAALIALSLTTAIAATTSPAAAYCYNGYGYHYHTYHHSYGYGYGY
jgi:hypothetical protein